MRVAVLAALFGFAMVGCARPRAVGVWLPAERRVDRAERASCNLALGPSAEHVRVATSLGRGRGPSVETGYRLEDVSFFSDVQYDDQFFYDRYGGHSRSATTVRTAVVLR